MLCPHCFEQIPKPPQNWANSNPWQCSFCAGLFAIDCDGNAFPIPADFEPLSPLLGFNVARNFCFYAGRQNHYVYALCYGSGLPFYVGRGQNERAISHEAEARNSKRSSRKLDTIRQLSIHGEPVWYHFLALVPDGCHAEAIENHYLRLWKHRGYGGILTNAASATSLDDVYEITPPGFPFEEPPVRHYQEAVAGWTHSVRVLHHPQITVPPPPGRAIVAGSVRCCPSCGTLGQYLRKHGHLKWMCGNCGHYFIPDMFSDEAKAQAEAFDDGSKRVFFHPDYESTAGADVL